MNRPLTNRLLDALPEEDRNVLLGLLEPVSLPLSTELFSAEARPRSVFFLTSGAASTVTEMTEGEAVEVGMVGREGMLGAIYLLGPHTGPTRCFMQIEGAGLRMSFRRFQQEFETRTALRRCVLEHVQQQTLILEQLSACNRLHEVEERLARWLLMVADRVGDSYLGLTQEFLSQMLGARRSTVTIVAGALQRSGLIEYRRGKVHILDRENLENAACECYGVTRRLFNSLYNEAPANSAHKEPDANNAKAAHAD